MLKKIDRVSYGLLSADDAARAEPSAPKSRLYLAVPFVGKDVPSRASEFAHPEIIIGLTVLTYRYEGLRRLEFEQNIIAVLRRRFETEVGPYAARASNNLFEQWITVAGGVVKGRMAVPEVFEEDDERIVAPLYLLSTSNRQQMTALYNLLRKSPGLIQWYLVEHVFPVRQCAIRTTVPSAHGRQAVSKDVVILILRHGRRQIEKRWCSRQQRAALSFSTLITRQPVADLHAAPVREAVFVRPGPRQ